MALEHRVLEDVRSFFNNEFAINHSDLQKPTYVFVRDFYARTLMEFEVDTDNVRKASHLIEGMDSDTVEISGDINLVAAINKTFNFLNFGLFDLLSPGDNVKRTVSMMSAVMEFMNMADDLTSQLDFDSYRDFRADVNHLAEQAENLRRQSADIALEKDRFVQKKIALEEDVAALKIKQSKLCAEVAEANKQSEKAESEMEERQHILKSIIDENEKLKIAIKTLKEELSFAQSLDSKEEQSRKFEHEKTELYKKYLDRVEVRNKQSAYLDAIKQFTTATESVSELFAEIGTREEALTNLQKEAADLESAVTVEKKEQAAMEREAVAVEESAKQLEEEMVKLKEEFKEKIEDATESQSKLTKSVHGMKEHVVSADLKLKHLNEELLTDQEKFRLFVDSLQHIMRKASSV